MTTPRRFLSAKLVSDMPCKSGNTPWGVKCFDPGVPLNALLTFSIMSLLPLAAEEAANHGGLFLSGALPFS
jgi:hypothetical protein